MLRNVSTHTCTEIQIYDKALYIIKRKEKKVSKRGGFRCPALYCAALGYFPI